MQRIKQQVEDQPNLKNHINKLMGEINNRVDKEFALSKKEEMELLQLKLDEEIKIQKEKEEAEKNKPKKIKAVVQTQIDELPKAIKARINKREVKRVKTPNVGKIKGIVRDLLNEGRENYLKNYGNSYEAKQFPMHCKSNPRFRSTQKHFLNNANDNEQYEEVPILMKTANLYKELPKDKKIYKSAVLSLPVFQESLAFRQLHHGEESCAI